MNETNMKLIDLIRTTDQAANLISRTSLTKLRIMALVATGDILQVKHLAPRLKLSVAAVSPHIQDLVKLGLMTRTMMMADRRANKLAVTELGIKALLMVLHQGLKPETVNTNDWEKTETLNLDYNETPASETCKTSETSNHNQD